MNEDARGVAVMLLSAVTFGTLGIFGKVAADAGLSIPTVLVWRFSLASVLVWVLLTLRGTVRPLRGRALATAVALGVGGYATMSGLYFVGLEYMTAGLVGIVLYTYPAFVVVLSTVRGESVSARTVAALALSFGGVVLITGADPAGVSPVGVAIVLGAAVVYATYIVVSEAVLDDVSPETLTAHVLPAAAVTFLLVGGVSGQLVLPANGYEWGVVGAIAVVATVVPILSFFAGLRIVGASRASIVSTVEPVATVTMGAVLLDEPVTTVTLVGGVLVLAGVVLVRE